MRKRRAMAAMALLGAASIVACGTDGVTPDCSAPAACAPNAGDGSAFDAEASTSRDGESDGKDGGLDAGRDGKAPADADADGG